MKRRSFLLGGLTVIGAGSAVVVGWGFLPARQRLLTADSLPVTNGAVSLNGWVRIAADGRIVVAMPRSEMGQGVSTALPMLLAEELDADWAHVSVEQAPDDRIFGNVAMLADGLPFHPDDQGKVRHAAEWVVGKVARELGLSVTGGSSSVRDAWLPMRQAGAAARAMLVDAAARRWNVDASQCKVARSVVSGPGGQQAGFGDLAGDWIKAGAAPVFKGDVQLKPAAQFALIGQEVARLDSGAKSRGEATFGIDVRLPGMLYAAIRMAPALGVTHAQVRNAPAGARVLQVPALLGQPAAVAVVADHYWQARQVLDALDITWDASPHATLASGELHDARRSALDKEDGFNFYKVGDVDAQLKLGKRIDAEYSAPYLAHAAMEPINCTAQVVQQDGKNKVSVWAPTQVPSIARMLAARVAGVSSSDVDLTVTYLGGGFGRRLEVDFVAQAVAIAKETGGKPVQLIWSREQDTAHDYYRPAAVGRFSASLDEQGQILAYTGKIACDAITPQLIGRDWPILGADSPDKTTAEGAFDLPYEIPAQRVGHVLVKSPVNIGFWRSVGHSYNAFFSESFIDELASAAGKDGWQFRRGLLKSHPRYLAVLDLAAQRHGWDKAPEPVILVDEQGKSSSIAVQRGIALHQSFGTIVAEAVDVSVQDGRIRVHRVTVAVDCGTPVNPNIIRQQVESGVVFGLSAALYGEITFKAGAVEQSNFNDYAVVRMPDAPQVDVFIVPSTATPTGMGEPAVPPIAPAVAAAVFAGTGKRLRSLPLRLA